MTIDLPFRVSTQQCNNGYYYSKAGIMCGSKPHARPIFGFGCSASQEKSEYLAKCECAEHYLGTCFAYTETELHASIEIRTFGSNEYFSNSQRQNLLIGANRLNGHKFTATGLTLGNASYDATVHAVQEVVERHLAYIWWNYGLFDTQVIANEESQNALSVVFLTNAFKGYLAIAAYIGQDKVCFGSAFRDEHNLAIDHAVNEQSMLSRSIQNMTNLPARHTKLTNKKFIAYVNKKVKARLNSKIAYDVNVISNIYLAQLYRFGDYQLIRAYSNNAHDISSKQHDSMSPFL